MAEDRLASEEPETEIETGQEALKVLSDLQSCAKAAGQRMAVMMKRKVLPHTPNLQADKTPFSSFATERRTWAVVTGTRPQKGDNAVR